MNPVKEKELEFTGDMMERDDIMDNAVYQMCLAFLGIESDDTEDKFPWDISILNEIREFTVHLLREQGYQVCDPYIERDDIDHYCSPHVCGFKKCELHP